MQSVNPTDIVLCIFCTENFHFQGFFGMLKSILVYHISECIIIKLYIFSHRKNRLVSRKWLLKKIWMRMNSCTRQAVAAHGEGKVHYFCSKIKWIVYSYLKICFWGGTLCNYQLIISYLLWMFLYSYSFASLTFSWIFTAFQYWRTDLITTHDEWDPVDVLLIRKTSE